MFVVFDYDGVVTNSFNATACAVRALHVHAEIPAPAEHEIHQWLGPPIGKSVVRLIQAYNLDDGRAREFSDTYFNEYVVASRTQTVLYVEVLDIVDELLASSVPIALATMKARTEMAAIGVALPGIDRFTIVEAPDHHDGGSTKAELVARAIKQLMADGAAGPGWMVGDRASDIEAGHANGLTAIGVSWGSGTKDELIAAGADYMADAPEDLRKTLLTTGYYP